MIVIDASLVLDLVLRRPNAVDLAHLLEAQDWSPCAPEVLDLEILQALRKQLLLGRIGQEPAMQAFSLLKQLPIERYSHSALLPRIWALRDNFTSYDAAYIALAERLDAELWTSDAKYARAPQHAARVHLFSSAP